MAFMSALALAALASAAAPRLAVVPLGPEVAAGAAGLASVLRPRYDVQAADIVEQALVSARATGLSCPFDDDGCWMKIGVSSDFDAILILALPAGSSMARAHLVDVTDGRHGPLVFGPKEALADLARRAIDPSAGGTLAVAGGSPGARLLVDDVEVGTLPLAAPLTRLAAGTHRLTSAGQATMIIEISEGAVTRVALPTAGAARPPASLAPAAARDELSFKEVAGVGAAVGVIAVVTCSFAVALIEQDLQRQLDDAQGERARLDAEQFHSQEVAQVALAAGAVAGVALAGGGLVGALWE
ncbi:MAG: hypothetical protein A2138_20985 [Deltaproteobacteria bacterium RBG_16_71_12]|nr:MAG: hypothetical protein A2138_20985 [Deltaproteobacteria bacterium RBG_16_71_12]